MFGVFFESGVGSLFEGDGNISDGVVVGIILIGREDGSVDMSFEVGFFVFLEEDEISLGIMEGFVGSGGYDVIVFERRVLFSSSDEIRDVGYVR